MNDPFRLKVLMALTVALEEITVLNGYQFDLAGHVFRGRTVLTEKDGLPALALNEPPQLVDAAPVPESASAKTVLTMLVQGFVKDDRVHPTDPAYRLLADVQQRIVREKIRDDGFNILGLGERITALRIGQGVVRPPDEVVSPTAHFWLPVTLTFGERLNEPFA